MERDSRVSRSLSLTLCQEQRKGEQSQFAGAIRFTNYFDFFHLLRNNLPLLWTEKSRNDLQTGVWILCLSIPDPPPGLLKMEILFKLYRSLGILKF